MKTILIYSGGLDSTTLLYKLRKDGDEILCLSFNYGQRHVKELLFAKRICKTLEIPHKIVDIRSIKSLMAGSALTSRKKVPEGHYTDKSMKDTVVPNRNMVFISLAAALAISARFDRVAIAVHAGDHAIYPDCRPAFIKAANAVLKTANYQPVKVHAPFLRMTKKQIAKLGGRLNVPFEKTWTCYKGFKSPCGFCGACIERKEAMSSFA